MINLELLRQNPDILKDSLVKRGGSAELIDQALTADTRYRAVQVQADGLRSERNQLTKTADLAKQHSARLGEIKDELKKLEEEEKTLAARRQKLLYSIPNILAEDVPVGPGESANTVIKTVGTVALPAGATHEELMVAKNWLDLQTAARVSGARFRYLKNEAVTAQMRLMFEAMALAISKGFTPILPPVIARYETLEQGGFFPGGVEDTFELAQDNLFLIGTSEPMLVAQAAGKVFETKDLPLRFVGFSSCFRKEAGSYGKDTKGMFRQHQFDKVELVSITTPEQSVAEHEFLLSLQEELVSRYDLPYQVVLIGSGDVESKAVKRYDLESWFPGQRRYRETHSTSNCSDFQARRFDIKYKTAEGQVEYAHTLNGTLATERLLLAIIENSQTAEGEVTLPARLKV